MDQQGQGAAMRIGLLQQGTGRAPVVQQSGERMPLGPGDPLPIRRMTTPVAAAGGGRRGGERLASQQGRVQLQQIADQALGRGCRQAAPSGFTPGLLGQARLARRRAKGRAAAQQDLVMIGAGFPALAGGVGEALAAGKEQAGPATGDAGEEPSGRRLAEAFQLREAGIEQGAPQTIQTAHLVPQHMGEAGQVLIAGEGRHQRQTQAQRPGPDREAVVDLRCQQQAPRRADPHGLAERCDQRVQRRLLGWRQRPFGGGFCASARARRQKAQGQPGAQAGQRQGQATGDDDILVQQSDEGRQGTDRQQQSGQARQQIEHAERQAEEHGRQQLQALTQGEGRARQARCLQRGQTRLQIEVLGDGGGFLAFDQMDIQSRIPQPLDPFVGLRAGQIPLEDTPGRGQQALHLLRCQLELIEQADPQGVGGNIVAAAAAEQEIVASHGQSFAQSSAGAVGRNPERLSTSLLQSRCVHGSQLRGPGPLWHALLADS